MFQTRMPRIYTRKTDRASWSQDSLIEAGNQISQGKIDIWKASKKYGIPYRTLKRRINENNFNKGALGRPSSLASHELKLMAYLQKIESTGYPLTTTTVRKLAFAFALKNNIPNMFNQDNEIAGYSWYRNFMIRHPTILVRKAEAISSARDMCREEVDRYFKLLSKICEENNFLDQPSKIYNVDETGLQLNSNSVKIVATKGLEEMHCIISAGKEETVNVIACCNAEGNFLPPYCILKNKMPELKDGLPPGSHVETGETTAYANCQLFLRWLKNHFVPRKQNGKVLLILDCHSSHCSDIDVLDFAAENDIILLCLPSHATNYLQPLSESFIIPLKTYWQTVVANYISGYPGRRLTGCQLGSLLSSAWNFAATIRNSTWGFKSCGVFPHDIQQIPKHAFRMSGASKTLENVSAQSKNEESDATER